jgi:poly(A) polymerase
MRFAHVREMKQSKVRRLIAAPSFDVELELHRLDCISCHGKMDCFTFLIDKLAESEEKNLPEPWVRGRDLVAAGITPQSGFSEVLQQCFERQLSGEDTSAEQSLAFAIDCFREKNNQ